ncbi:hypothetical protein [Vibrio comitans]|nr:hypothetical protein [Vibrio comitans]
MKSIKNVILAIIIASSLSACAMKDEQLVNDLHVVKVGAEASQDEVYSAVVQCVLDNVNPPMSGQLFTYESEKNHALAFVYSFKSDTWNSPLIGPIAWDSRATIRLNKEELQAQGVQVWVKPSQYDSGGWREGNNRIKNRQYSKVNSMLETIGNCVPTYL